MTTTIHIEVIMVSDKIEYCSSLFPEKYKYRLGYL